MERYPVIKAAYNVLTNSIEASYHSNTHRGMIALQGDAKMATIEENSVPQWFHNFAIANEKAHSDLSNEIAGIRTEIAGVKGELGIIKTLMLAGIGALFLGAVSGFVAFLKYALGF